MELRHLRYFVAVAEERHFGHAADRLQMAQPPLSQAIRKLEADLGVELLSRTTRRVELTAAGTAYLERARQILADVDGAGHEARQVAAGSLGRLAIGCVGSATYSLVPRLARGLATRLPGIDFAFRGEMLVPEQVRALRAREIDIALLRPPVRDEAISVEVLRRDRLVAALPHGHRLAREGTLDIIDLVDDPFVVHSGRRDAVMYDTVVRLARSAGFAPRIRHEVEETSTLVTLVAGGLGVAIAPEPVSALQLPGVAYVPLADPQAWIELAVAFVGERDEPHLHRAVATVAEMVKE